MIYGDADDGWAYATLKIFMLVMLMMSGRYAALHFLKMMAGRACAAFNKLVLMMAGWRRDTDDGY